MRNNDKIKRILSLLLLAVFFFPSMVQLEHMIDGHEHDICHINTEHVHEAKSNCKINDFQFTPFQFDTLQQHETFSPIVFGEELIFYKLKDYQSSKHAYYRLRAPPSFS